MSMLSEIVIFLAAAVIMVPLARWAGLGAVLGFLSAGVLIGPWVLGLIDDVDTILHLSELGVVLLLFLIGLELKPSRIVGAQTTDLPGRLGPDADHHAAAVATGGLVEWKLGGWRCSSVWCCRCQSTGDGAADPRREASTRHGSMAGRPSVSLLLQDIAVIPLLAIIPLFAVGSLEAEADGSILIGLLEATAVIAGLILAWSDSLLRPMLRAVAATNVPEVFRGHGVAGGRSARRCWSSTPGLSMGTGRVSCRRSCWPTPEYRHEIEAAIDPFKGLLLGLFFYCGGYVHRFRAGHDPRRKPSLPW